MSIPYRTRCVLKRLGIGILILAVAFVVVALYLFADLEQYVVYTRQGAKLDFSVSNRNLSGETVVKRPMETVKGYYYNQEQTEQTEQPSHESPTPEPTPSENSAKADGANAEKALPQATAAKSSVLFTERQRHFMASKLKSIEDPSPNSTEFGTNMRSYADDAKAFGR